MVRILGFWFVLISFILSCSSRKKEETVSDQQVEQALAIVDDSPIADETQSGFDNAAVALGEVSQDSDSTDLSSSEFSNNDGSVENSEFSNVVDQSNQEKYSIPPTTNLSARSKRESSKGSSKRQQVATSVFRFNPPQVVIQGADTLNTFLIVRKPDWNWKKLALWIYGDESKAHDLKRWNSNIKHLYPGVVVYYRSPNRPDDNQMMFWFEDLGQPVQTYEVQKSVGLASLAKILLGYPQGWKELIYANPELSGTQSVKAGMIVRYWPSESVVQLAQRSKPVEQPQLAMNDVNQTPLNESKEQTEMVSLDQEAGVQSDFQSSQMLAPELSNPNNVESMSSSVGTGFSDAPGSQPVMESGPIPPPSQPPIQVTPPVAQRFEDNLGSLMDNQDLSLILGAAGVALAGIVALLIIRRKRKKNSSQFNLDTTQSGVVNQ